jgi:hypothetical protein
MGVKNRQIRQNLPQFSLTTAEKPFSVKEKVDFDFFSRPDSVPTRVECGGGSKRMERFDHLSRDSKWFRISVSNSS